MSDEKHCQDGGFVLEDLHHAMRSTDVHSLFVKFARHAATLPRRLFHTSPCSQTAPAGFGRERAPIEPCLCGVESPFLRALTGPVMAGSNPKSASHRERRRTLEHGLRVSAICKKYMSWSSKKCGDPPAHPFCVSPIWFFRRVLGAPKLQAAVESKKEEQLRQELKRTKEAGSRVPMRFDSDGGSPAFVRFMRGQRCRSKRNDDDFSWVAGLMFSIWSVGRGSTQLEPQLTKIVGGKRNCTVCSCCNITMLALRMITVAALPSIHDVLLTGACERGRATGPTSCDNHTVLTYAPGPRLSSDRKAVDPAGWGHESVKDGSGCFRSNCDSASSRHCRASCLTK